jgi:hypothetical protein
MVRDDSWIMVSGSADGLEGLVGASGSGGDEFLISSAAGASFWQVEA